MGARYYNINSQGILPVRAQPSAAMPKPLSLAAVNAAKAAAVQASAEANKEAAALPAPAAVAALPAPEGSIPARCMHSCTLPGEFGCSWGCSLQVVPR